MGCPLNTSACSKNGSILGKTIFDDGLETVYDQERHEYILFPVTAGTILIDASLCENEESAGGCVSPAPMNWPTGSCTKNCTRGPERVRL